MMQQHEGEQAPGLRLIGHERDEEPREPNCLVAQLVANEIATRRCRVALGEDEIDHCEDRGEACGKVVVGRDLIRNAGDLDLALGARQALAHCRLGHEEGAGDLRCGEAAQGPQREGHARLHREGRMAAREHEAKSIVGD
jgi:hypothetical protein